MPSYSQREKEEDFEEVKAFQCSFMQVESPGSKSSGDNYFQAVKSNPPQMPKIRTRNRNDASPPSGDKNLLSVTKKLFY